MILADSGIVMVDGTFLATLSNKISHGTTLGRPFQGFRVATQILQGSGCQFWPWLFEVIANWVRFDQKPFENHSKSCFCQERHAFLRKKAPGRAAPHRSPNWGCTNPPIPTHQNIKSWDFGGRRQRRQPVNYMEYDL